MMTPEEQKAFEDAKAAAEKLAAEVVAVKKASDEYKADMLKKKDDAASLQAKLQEIEAEKKKQEEAKLANEGQFKTLLESKVKENEVIKAELEKFKKGFIATQIDTEVEKEALALGMDSKNLPLLKAWPKTGVEAQFVTGANGTTIQVTGAKNMLEAFRTQFPPLFGKVSASGVASGAGDAGIENKAATTLSSAELTELEKKNPAKYMEILGQLLKPKA